MYTLYKHLLISLSKNIAYDVNDENTEIQNILIYQ